MKNLSLVSVVVASILGGAVLGGGVACLPSPKPVTTNYVVLAGREPAAVPSTPTATLGLARVTLPGYLDRGEVATRTGNRITYSPTDRWAEPLAQSVPRLLVEDLSAALGPSGMNVSLQSIGDIDLVVAIERFELDGNGHCILDARYSLRDVATDRVVKTGSARYDETPAAPTGDATASALAKALDRLAGDVAQGVGTVRAAATR